MFRINRIVFMVIIAVLAMFFLSACSLLTNKNSGFNDKIDDEYTITYNNVEGSDNSLNPSTYTIKTPTFTLYDPIHPDYEFAFWYFDEEYITLADTTIDQGSTGNLTFYAVWATEGLEYKSLGTSPETLEIGIGTAIATDIFIPKTKDGHEIVAIAYNGFKATNIEMLTIPNSVKSIGDDAFRDSSSLRKITILSSVTSIGTNVLTGCTSLETLTAPFISSYNTSNNSYLRYFFGGTAYNKGGIIPSSLKTVIITEGSTKISNDAFNGCSNLTSIAIPDSITSIESSAFSNCNSLTNINFGDNSQLKSIGWRAFAMCSNLTSITIPDSVTSIGYYSFYGCTSLESIEVSEDNTNYKSIEGVLFNKEGTTLLQYPIANNRTSYIVPSSVTNIDSAAFFGCTRLTSITFGDELSSIGKSAFHACSNLTSVTFGDELSSIGEGAFYACSSLASVTFGENSKLKTIGSSAFGLCSSLIRITIPESVTKIYTRAFSSSLKIVIFTSKNPPILESSVFSISSDSTLMIYVPSNRIFTYKNANGWSDYEDRIFAID